MVKRYLESDQHTVSERVTVYEVHIVLLDKGELQSVTEHITVFKASLQSEEELPFHRPELRSEAEAQHPVLVTGKAVLVHDAAVPIVTFPKVRLPPVVADLTEYLHGIAVGQRMLIADSRVERGGEQEAGIDRQFAVLCGRTNRCHRTQ